MTRTEAIGKAFGIQADIASRAAEAPRSIHHTLTEANKVLPDRVLAEFNEAIRDGKIGNAMPEGTAAEVDAAAKLVRAWVERLADAYVELAVRMREKSIELETRAATLQEASGIVLRSVDVDATAAEEPTPGQ